MRDDKRLARLDEHQAAILDILRRGERMLHASERDVAGLARARWELARAILGYQGFKHREIFDPAAAGAPSHAALARRLKAECVATGESFRAYLSRWSSVSVGDHWAEYQPAALALIATIRTHLARERREAQPLLDERPATSSLRRTTPPRA